MRHPGGASSEPQEKTLRAAFQWETIFALPGITVLRPTLNHLNHHLARLHIYLGLNGLPIPALYGPSADEGRMQALVRSTPSFRRWHHWVTVSVTVAEWLRLFACGSVAVKVIV